MLFTVPVGFVVSRRISRGSRASKIRNPRRDIRIAGSRKGTRIKRSLHQSPYLELSRWPSGVSSVSKNDESNAVSSKLTRTTGEARSINPIHFQVRSLRSNCIFIRRKTWISKRDVSIYRHLTLVTHNIFRKLNVMRPLISRL